MTTRYVALRRAPGPRAWINDYNETLPAQPTVTVIEGDPAPAETGLLDAHGTPLYRVAEREPIGFRLRRG
jgi:hypothetical protein